MSEESGLERSVCLKLDVGAVMAPRAQRGRFLLRAASLPGRMTQERASWRRMNLFR